ncbi:UDP-N-acetylmuramoyl-tripeptide--D-alanyl-D-alanine ligase [Aureibacillus halotolerans]|uniref:UDP-N-acetylmuramoyl-tripeptide--D-alanyl-D-alanine ligase n=1 Tax=Aureibacillus halotolerans TaxID=1508390 RepID=A0A4R6UB95_9BACI|nr:UDP-N-acetylmuramoyl-tripeptide--D-alanyl-D-alanine ligase [Aureibacillus halotolerans]TDQ42323.1 UDP-N-acetylmuramoyl-tripeptide--D-alanyl-D-alanine ligase [Aureibacillus halotolerans]
MRIKLKTMMQHWPEYRLAPVAPEEISLVTKDSRSTQPNALYVPIVGERLNGHLFAEEAVSNGAEVLFWQKEEPVPPTLQSVCSIFFVEDTTVALQQLAQLYRFQVNPFVIAITGSNGKTTVKDLVAGVCEKKGKTHKTAGNLNNHIGVPMTLLSMPDDCAFLIVEMGMNHAGEIEVLSKLAAPDMAIVTNVGESHIEFLGSRENIAKAKLEIAEGLKADGALLVDGDEPLLSHPAIQADGRIGFTDRASVRLRIEKTDLHGQNFVYRGESYSLALLGAHNSKNAAYAIEVGSRLGLSHEQIQAGLTQAAFTPMRMQLLTGPNEVTIINDAYNASPTSMRAALTVLKDMAHRSAKVAVLGDIFELGEPYDEEMHRSVGGEVTSPITALIAIGEKARWIAEETMLVTDGSVHVHHVKTKEEALELLRPFLHDDALLLFKASRGMALEWLIDQLMKE